jgi:hypothetical protein
MEQNSPAVGAPVEPPVRLLSDEQAAFIGRKLARHINAGATISALTPGEALQPLPDGSVYGGLKIFYPPAA